MSRMFIRKSKYEVEKLIAKQRIEYLENIICPNLQHDFRKVGKKCVDWGTGPDDAIYHDIFNIPDSEIDEGLSTTYIYTKTRVLKGGSQDYLKERITFNREWWNAPYKKESEK